ncbi:hypothetical protein GW17_00034528 [Ensete ventricosum]|nr:hypothetical protein GW17_00034528 [Ensete ventricosum]
MHRVNAIGNSLGVRRELAEGIKSLTGWRKGVRQKKTETRQKIEIRRRDEKLAGNMLGDCRKKTIGLAARMPEAAGLGRSLAFRGMGNPLRKRHHEDKQAKKNV